MSLKPICVKCRCFYRPEKNGTWFIEGMPKGGSVRAPRGNAAPEQWKPYKLWVGDYWECPECHHGIIVGTPQGPYREHYQPDFADEVKRRGAAIQINDC